MIVQDLRRRALELCFANKCYDEAEKHNHFCLYHWRTLPEDLQRVLWSQYSIRQDLFDQCAEWKKACIAAIELIAAREGTASAT